MTVVAKLPVSLSPDNGTHTVSLSISNPASLVVAAVHISLERQTPCAKIVSHRNPGRYGLFLQDKSNFLKPEHANKLVIMNVMGKMRETSGNAHVCRLLAKMPDNKVWENIPGSYLLFDKLEEADVNRLPKLYEKRLLQMLEDYRAAVNKGMYRGRSMQHVFDKIKYTDAVRSEYTVERASGGSATYFIARKDKAPMTTVDWFFLQRYLWSSSDKLPVLENPNNPDYYVVTRAAALAE